MPQDMTPLMIASCQGFTDVVKLLLKVLDIDANFQDEQVCVHFSLHDSLRNNLLSSARMDLLLSYLPAKKAILVQWKRC